MSDKAKFSTELGPVFGDPDVMGVPPSGWDLIKDNCEYMRVVNKRGTQLVVMDVLARTAIIELVNNKSKSTFCETRVLCRLLADGNYNVELAK